LKTVLLWIGRFGFLMSEKSIRLSKAIEDFRQARRLADLEMIMARLTGRSVDLLSYQDVRRALRVESLGGRELKEIPVEAILGSVDRYQDFTRSYLPRRDGLRSRWASVKVVADNLTGWPPIEVYQIGEVYFVQDGNHRVSVARQLGMSTIQAYVTVVKTKVPLTADLEPDNLLSKALYADFLEKTRLDAAYPDLNLETTSGGAYQSLEEHIGVHRYFMGLEQGREIPVPEAAAHWYETVYMPTVNLILARGMLREFPTRTTTDLYLWLSDHQGELQDSLGWEISAEAVVEDLTSKHSPRPSRWLDRIGRKVVDTLLPDEIEPGPEPGEWRRERLSGREPGGVFQDILVPVENMTQGWESLDQALMIAKREGSRLLGLHILSAGEAPGTPETQAIKEVFETRCREAGIEGVLTFQLGPIARRVSDLARFADLVLLNISHPPGDTIRERVSSGLRTLILRCPRPILGIPHQAVPFEKALLAYDGSPKSEEALFLAATLAETWGVELVVVTVGGSETRSARHLDHGRDYLDSHSITADYIHLSGDPAERILAAADIHNCDTVILGGYGARPVIEMVLGSTADRVLQAGNKAVFICQ
jgi:nucleotide-binding universal stress UspA family protein